MRDQKMAMILLCVLLFASLLMAQTDLPKAKLPVLTTSAGQSADATTLNVILEQADVMYDYCDVPTVAMLKSGVGLGGETSGEGFHVEIMTDLEKFPEKTAYRSMIFAIGASLKGMGASGLTVDDELKRLKSIIQYCKENKIFIIALHVGGESKRGASGSNNEKMIDAVAPFADYIIVAEDGNKDGRFTRIAKDKGVPISQVKYALGIVELMEAVYH